MIYYFFYSFEFGIEQKNQWPKIAPITIKNQWFTFLNDIYRNIKNLSFKDKKLR